ncbi:putative atherin [Iris pallida]|uniref:Atherin n=1 Tax=Iris pallida TaxID=29817 RepID=A0AAX6HD37_IRIPA|nr:putative atherin [Iris pallida]
MMRGTEVAAAPAAAEASRAEPRLLVLASWPVFAPLGTFGTFSRLDLREVSRLGAACGSLTDPSLRRFDEDRVLLGPGDGDGGFSVAGFLIGRRLVEAVEVGWRVLADFGALTGVAGLGLR